MMQTPSIVLAGWAKIGLIAGGIGLVVGLVAAVALIVILASRRGRQSSVGRAQATESIEKLGLGLDKMEQRLTNIETILTNESAGDDDGRDGAERKGQA